MLNEYSVQVELRRARTMLLPLFRPTPYLRLGMYLVPVCETFGCPDAQKFATSVSM